MTVIHQNPTSLAEQILQLIFFQITPSKVVDILQMLKLGKASGLDSISHQMLKKTCNTVCVRLSLLFNLSLSKSEFPTQ